MRPLVKRVVEGEPLTAAVVCWKYHYQGNYPPYYDRGRVFFTVSLSVSDFLLKVGFTKSVRVFMLPKVGRRWGKI